MGLCRILTAAGCRTETVCAGRRPERMMCLTHEGHECLAVPYLSSTIKTKEIRCES
jgi:hypothetical protein